MKALAGRVIRQVAGDRRSAAMIVLAPLLVLTLLYLLLGGTSYKPTIAVDADHMPPQLITALEAQGAKTARFSKDMDAAQYLRDDRNIDAVLTVSASGGSNLTMYESGNKSAQVMKAVQGAMASLNPSAAMKVSYVYGTADASTFDSLGFVFFGFLAFFIIFLVSSMSLVRERSGGTLERLLMSPVSRAGVTVGYAAGYGVFAVVQAAVMMLFGVYVLGVRCAGNVLWAILAMLLLALSAVSFGSLISVFANTELQVVQFVPVAIIPQVFFSGLIPLDTIPYGLGNLGYLTPVFYGCTALKGVMVYGQGFPNIWPYLLGLIVYIALLSALNTLALKKYRKL